jgi:glutathione S-transferase
LKKPNRRIDVLNEILADTDFLVEGEFSVADVAVASYLLYVLQFFPGVNLSRWPNVVRYMKVSCLRPAYAMAFGDGVQSSLVKALTAMGEGPTKVFGMF